MSVQRIAPPGINAELAASPRAPVEYDRGFLIRAMADVLLADDEPQVTVVDALTAVNSHSEVHIDTSITAPKGSAEEVTRAHIDGLPAREFWQDNTLKYKVIPKLNAKGLIDDKALIADVQATISPEFVWSGKADRHHLYWPRADYVAAQQITGDKAYSFREHGSNIIRVQRVFHNWMHAISEQPPMPDPEVMHYTLRAWEIVSDFFGAVRQTVNHQRLFGREELRRGGYTDNQNEMIRDMLLRELSGVVMHLDLLADIPEDYWPFRPDIKLQIAAGQVGQVLTKGYLNRTREVRLASVA